MRPPATPPIGAAAPPMNDVTLAELNLRLQARLNAVKEENLSLVHELMAQTGDRGTGAFGGGDFTQYCATASALAANTPQDNTALDAKRFYLKALEAQAEKILEDRDTALGRYEALGELLEATDAALDGAQELVRIAEERAAALEEAAAPGSREQAEDTKNTEEAGGEEDVAETAAELDAEPDSESWAEEVHVAAVADKLASFHAGINEGDSVEEEASDGGFLSGFLGTVTKVRRGMGQTFTTLSTLKASTQARMSKRTCRRQAIRKTTSTKANETEPKTKTVQHLHTAEPCVCLTVFAALSTQFAKHSSVG
jgi:hypothetical protein